MTALTTQHAIDSASPAVRAKRSLGTVCYWALAWGYMAVVVYTSLVPFAFRDNWPTATNWPVWLGHTLTSPTWHPMLFNRVSSMGRSNILNDWLTNILLYAPAGLMLRLHWARRARAWRGVVLAGLTVLVVSWMVECTQTLMRWRDGTLQDVLANVGGATVAATLAIRLRSTVVRAVVWAYRRCAYPIGSLRIALEKQRQKPYMLAGVIAVNVALLACWCRWGSYGRSGQTVTINLMPFAGEMNHSYDVAALHVGGSLAVYLLVGLLLALPMLSVRQRGRLGMVVLATAVLALARELLDHGLFRQTFDVTQPIIAAMAGLSIVAVSYLCAIAVHHSCRRKTKHPVEFERRRRPHEYSHEH